MPGIKFSNEVSLWQIAQSIALIFLAGWAWADVKGADATTNRRMDSYEMLQASVNARQDERLTDAITQIGKLTDAIERVATSYENDRLANKGIMTKLETIVGYMESERRGQ